MKDETPTRRVIIRKKKVHGGGHHGGAWKVAYADFVTTLMALFIVLWIVGQGASVREAIAKYFRDPGVFRPGGATAMVSGGAGVLTGERGREGIGGEGEHAIEEEHSLQAAAADIRELLRKGGLFEGVREQIAIEVTPDGLRIELMERETSTFFRVGSAVVTDSTRPVLGNVAAVLSKLPNPITVEGHTDSRPYQYSFARPYTNWELSTDRANSARRLLEAAGLSAGRIDRVVGYADRVPILDHDPLHPSNRRITIVVRRTEGSTAPIVPPLKTPVRPAAAEIPVDTLPPPANSARSPEARADVVPPRLVTR